MLRTCVWMSVGGLLAFANFAQLSEPAARFEVADVHPSTGRFMRGPFVGGGRYEIHTATMLDLIRTAYTVDNDKIFGGPSWLEMDHFDIIAKLPPGTSAESRKTLLQGLLADRFKLVVHNDTKPLPAYALSAGKHGGLKEPDPAAEPGCKMDIQSGGPPPPSTPGEPVMMVPMVVYTCHKTTMASLADQMYRMIGVPQYLSNRRVVDQTGLEGAWDFNFKYSLAGMMRIGGSVATVSDTTTIFDAVDKQLGLKLESSTAPMAVLVVDSVNRKPSENSPESLKSLPAQPTEFEVAEIKPSAPGADSGPMLVNGGMVMVARKVGGRGGAPGPPIQNGRVNLVGQTLKSLMILAWDANNDTLLGLPKSADSDRYDVVAKIPTTGGAYEGNTDTDTIRPMLKTLLIDSFKIKFHQEERPGNAYVLTAVKPKLKPADPANRSKCAVATGPINVNASLTRDFVCSNVTMAEFAELLPNMGPAYFGPTPVVDETKLEGVFDFNLNFSPQAGGIGGRGGPIDAGGGASASDPSGGMSLFDALTKQLGLKAEQQKRTIPVTVIDHIEPKPVEN